VYKREGCAWTRGIGVGVFGEYCIVGIYECTDTQGERDGCFVGDVPAIRYNRPQDAIATLLTVPLPPDSIAIGTRTLSAGSFRTRVGRSGWL
jgi:hypothetical protein